MISSWRAAVLAACVALGVASSALAQSASPAPDSPPPPPAPRAEGRRPGFRPPKIRSASRVALTPKTIIFMKGNSTWDKALDNLQDAFKSVYALIERQGLAKAGPAMTIYTQGRRHRLSAIRPRCRSPKRRKTRPRATSRSASRPAARRSSSCIAAPTIRWTTPTKRSPIISTRSGSKPPIHSLRNMKTDPVTNARRQIRRHGLRPAEIANWRWAFALSGGCHASSALCLVRGFFAVLTIALLAVSAATPRANAQSELSAENHPGRQGPDGDHVGRYRAPDGDGNDQPDLAGTGAGAAHKNVPISIRPRCPNWRTEFENIQMRYMANVMGGCAGDLRAALFRRLSCAT